MNDVGRRVEIDDPLRHRTARRLRAGLPLLGVLLLATALPGCSIRRMAINSLANSLSASGDVFASDDDPELVRDATPFALKTMETLLDEAPDHPGLLLSACRGFTQYAYAFVETDAEVLGDEDWSSAQALRARALRLYLRARGYGFRALELAHPGIVTRLRNDPATALAGTGPRDVELLYWTAAAWGSAISLGKDRPDLLADSSAVRALLERTLELDEAWDRGSVHEAMITIESLPAVMGGSQERARGHFRRAVELAGGSRASPYVSLAVGVALPNQDRAEFESLLRQALAVDPDRTPEMRLANLVVQRRARALLDRADDLFLNDREEIP
jgi:predicted anti-sigma-YlaC factor YlaD